MFCLFFFYFLWTSGSIHLRLVGPKKETLAFICICRNTSRSQAWKSFGHRSRRFHGNLIPVCRWFMEDEPLFYICFFCNMFSRLHCDFTRIQLFLMSHTRLFQARKASVWNWTCRNSSRCQRWRFSSDPEGSTMNQSQHQIDRPGHNVASTESSSMIAPFSQFNAFVPMVNYRRYPVVM